MSAGPEKTTWTVSCRFNTVHYHSGDPAYCYEVGQKGNDDEPDKSHNNTLGTNNSSSEACPSFKYACSSNMQSDISDAFDDISSETLIKNEQLDKAYNMVTKVANNRGYSNISEPSNIKDHNTINHNDYATLRKWVNGISGAVGTVEYERKCSVIDASGWTQLSEKLQYIASMCKNVNYIECPSNSCKCNTVCTCNCHSDY